jgi:hypothetical protein
LEDGVGISRYVHFSWILDGVYQNQQEPQPRERDYFYVGAFFVFSIWIALGIHGIIEVMREKYKEHKLVRPLTFAILILGFVAIPVSMLKANWFEHNRANNFVPWDYAYNLLQSVEENAILFTNGDNDTFPLWYLQDVEGVRRDVRIANLSLLTLLGILNNLKTLLLTVLKKLPLVTVTNNLKMLDLQDGITINR